MEETERLAVAAETGNDESHYHHHRHHNHHRIQEIWSWGAGTDGQLGTGNPQDSHSPQPLISSLPPPLQISILSCGGAHVLALTSCKTIPLFSLPFFFYVFWDLILLLMILVFGYLGVLGRAGPGRAGLGWAAAGRRVLSWGRGTSGQLGHGDGVNRLRPEVVSALEGVVVASVSAGWNHSGFVSDSGQLYTSGDGSFGQLGHGDYQSYRSPSKVSFFGSLHVEQIACGMRHSLVLIRADYETQVYGFGYGKRGQLGISKDKIKSSGLPQLCAGLHGAKITTVFANGDHSAALTADGQFYTWGRGFSGITSDVSLPLLLQSSMSFKQVALGWNHALLLTGEGDLFMLGSYRHEVLGETNSTESMNQVMVEVQSLDRIKIVQIAAGAEHSALVTENGEIRTWGWGEHGQLGLGDTRDWSHPQVVRLGGDEPVIDHCTTMVYCGSGFTVAVRMPSSAT